MFIDSEFGTADHAVIARKPEKMNMVKWNQILRESPLLTDASSPVDLDANVEEEKKCREESNNFDLKKYFLENRRFR